MRGSLIRAFEAQVAKGAARTALLCDGRTITYGELDRRANQLGRFLHARGARGGDRIVVALDRSIGAFVVILGAMKAGCAWVPLDASPPVLRVRTIVADARATMLVATDPELACPAFEGTTVLLPEIEAELARESGEDLEDHGELDISSQLCCVLYTSGTTGQPNGVLVSSGAILNHASWMWQSHPFRDGDLALIHRPCMSMAATWDYFGPLVGGAPALILPGRHPVDPANLIRACIDHGVSHASGSPGFWRGVLDRPRTHLNAWDTLRLGVASGEDLPVRVVIDWRRAFPRATLLNVYGTTEAVRPAACDTATVDELDTRVPIGTPLPNVTMYVAGEKGEPLEPGSVGEITVAGECVTRGYLDRPALTRERFVRDPFGGQGEAFRTGDLGRQRSDGSFEILGRLDHQVKCQGGGVVLEEVEAALHAFAPVRNAVVAVREDARQGRHLVGYVVPMAGFNPTLADFRTFLESRLPDYMIPVSFALVARIPLTPSGKVDRLAMSACDGAEPQGIGEATGPPATTTEDELARIWSAVIGVSEIGREATFIELGGHSLMAMQIASRVQLEFDVELPLDSFFPNPSLAAMAATIDMLRTATDGVR